AVPVINRRAREQDNSVRMQSPFVRVSSLCRLRSPVPESTVPGSLCPLAACLCKFIMVLGWYSTISRALAKGGRHLLPEQFNGIPHHRLGHPTDVMVGTEDVVPDALLALFELADDCLGAAHDGQAILEVELVALGRQTHGLAARLVVGTLTVAAHAAGVC